MPLFRKRSTATKDRNKSQKEIAKVEKPLSQDVNVPVVDKNAPPNGQRWAESVFKEQGWSNDTLEQKQGLRAQGLPTPPSSPPYYLPSVPSMPRSKSSPQALPYHRPWNRHLASSYIDPSKQQQVAPKEAPLSSSPKAKSGAMPLSHSWSQATSHSYNRAIAAHSIDGNIMDFRISPSVVASPTPAQRKQVIDTARRISLKKAKAPSEFNILVMGGRMTGKTSWIRTLLSTCDLGYCSEETKIAAAQFGISASSIHSSRRTDPITPLATKAIDYLGGIELQTNSLLPLVSLEQQAPARPPSHTSTRASIFSTSTSTTTSKRLHLSICDTPGIDFDIEDDFETQRKVSKIVKHVESKLSKTLAEEGKVQRRSKSDDYVHLIVYFIDPRHLVEKSESRRKEVRQGRSAKVGSENRARSNSESQTQGRPSFIKNHDSSLAVNGDTQKVVEEESSIEGLSPIEVNIIARMSKYANVLPIIAKADTLTLSRLYEVRQAVRRSLKAAKIDLGTFDIASSMSRKKMQSSSVGNEMVETMNAGVDPQPIEKANEKGDVKVIQVRSRRSFSASGPRPTSSAMGHGEESEAGHSSSLHRHTSSLQSTEPLFPGGAEEEVDGDAVDKAHEDLLKMMPLSIFVPEPIQIYRKKKSLIIRRPSKVDEQEVEIMQPPSNGVPPVPPLPRMPIDMTRSVDSGDGTPRDSEEIGTALSPTPTDYPHSYPLPAALLPSNRYERNYRWGTANVLDPEQCDFGLLRTTILGTHLESLKESTSMRYEQFRSRRLELNQQLRQGITSTQQVE